MTTEVTTLDRGPMSQEAPQGAEKAVANLAKSLQVWVLQDFLQLLQTEGKAEVGAEVGREQMSKAQGGLLNLTWTTNTPTMVAHPRSTHGATDFWLVLQE
jgi:hypothetical protein